MEHEKFRQQILEKLQSLDIEMTNKEKEFSNKEKMLIKHCQEIEGSVIYILYLRRLILKRNIINYLLIILGN